MSNWAAMGVNILISFFMMPFVIRELGTSAYGFWALLQSVIAYMFLLDFGVRSSLNRHLAGFYARGSHEEANRVFNTGLVVYLLICLAVVLLSCLFGVTFHWFFPLQEVDPTAVVWVVTLIGASVALRFPGAVFDSGLSALQRFDLINLAQVASLFVRTAMIIISLQSGYGLLAIAAATFFGSLLSVGLSYLLAAGICPSMRLSVSLADM